MSQSTDEPSSVNIVTAPATKMPEKNRTDIKNYMRASANLQTFSRIETNRDDDSTGVGHDDDDGTYHADDLHVRAMPHQQWFVGH